MAKTKEGKVGTVDASKKASNGVVGTISVELVVVDGKLVADTSPGVRQ